MTTEEERDEQLPTKEEIAARLEQDIERVRTQVTTLLGSTSAEATAGVSFGQDRFGWAPFAIGDPDA